MILGANTPNGIYGRIAATLKPDPQNTTRSFNLYDAIDLRLEQHHSSPIFDQGIDIHINSIFFALLLASGSVCISGMFKVTTQ